MVYASAQRTTTAVQPGSPVPVGISSPTGAAGRTHCQVPLAPPEWGIGGASSPTSLLRVGGSCFVPGPPVELPRMQPSTLHIATPLRLDWRLPHQEPRDASTACSTFTAPRARRLWPRTQEPSFSSTSRISATQKEQV